jgi:glycosyltransferase involved in cell wall biosynthesis
MKFGIVIPTLNRKDLLYEALQSLEKQQQDFNNLLIIDNGKQKIDISTLSLWTSGKTTIYEPGYNMGVGGSWNYGIKAFRAYDYILFLNDDIVLAEDQIKKIRKSLDDHWLINGPYYWSVFAMAQPCWEHFLKTDGFVFDEKFYPAYYEDNDFARRLELIKPGLICTKAEFEPLVKRNSMTIEKDANINNNFDKNKNYYISKWGGIPGHEKYNTPFNK